ncbi:hypothetical protein JFQ93_002514 [Aeromonas sobria]|nr:hypothetical protein [Aeromonas sobria]
MTDNPLLATLGSMRHAHSVDQVIPATGWFFRNASGNVIPVAAWCKAHDGRVYGMVAPTSGDFGHLAIHEGENGVYLHESQLESGF